MDDHCIHGDQRDTDSKLSGSAIVDSVMKKFRTRGFKEYPPVMSGEISFDPVADQRFVETQQPFSGGNLDPRLRIGVMNPAMTSSPRNSPGTQRRPVPGSTASPKSSVRANGNLGIGHGSNRHKKDLLSPVPETSSISSGARVVGGGERDANGHILVRGSSFSSGAASTHPPPASVLSTPLRGSMGSIASKGGRLQGDGHLHGGPNHHRPSEHGARGHVVKADLPRDTSYHSTISGAGRYDPTEPFERSVSVARSDISQFKDSKEPNLNDVVDYLASTDPNLVIRAASYLQHLSYGDDSMKAKIRTFGAIPVLVSQLRNAESRVHIAVLTTMKNLSYGRANDENKLAIVAEQGLEELMNLLKTTRVPEVRDLVTAVVCNMAACEALKQQILDSCLADLMSCVVVPSVGWRPSDTPDTMPTSIQWCVELRNTTGALRSLSGEQAIGQMRTREALVDCLVWIVKAGGQANQQCDDKTVENAVCILRNLSYHLDEVPEFKDGHSDGLDDEDDVDDGRSHDNRGHHKHHSSSISILPGCLLLCARPLTDDYAGIPMPARVALSDSEIHYPVVGLPMLWHPNTVRSYIALIEKYSACPDTLEGAAGAIQNLTAYSCKWSARTRVLVCDSQGLQLLVEMINSTHDMAVRTACLALRNLCNNSANKIAVGAQAIVNIVPRLPFGHNHLGISEHTTVALLCCLTKLCSKCPENSRLLGSVGGVSLVLRLTRSRQHTQKLVFASSKLCAVLYASKDCKTLLKREGWDLDQYTRMCKENAIELEYDTTEMGSEISRKSKKREEVQEHAQTSGSAHSDLKPAPLPLTSSSSLSKSEDAVEPGYSTVNATMATGTHSHPPPLQPVGMYQSINDPQLKETVDKIKQDNMEHTSGSVSRKSSLELCEQPAGAGAAAMDTAVTYAHVDVDKKRASRRKREGEGAGEHTAKQQGEAAATSAAEPDSWV
ncbi:hypothetical protein EMCRGX_G023120 [Ephydatia muelleri]